MALAVTHADARKTILLLVAWPAGEPERAELFCSQQLSGGRRDGNVRLAWAPHAQSVAVCSHPVSFAMWTMWVLSARGVVLACHRGSSAVLLGAEPLMGSSQEDCLSWSPDSLRLAAAISDGARAFAWIIGLQGLCSSAIITLSKVSNSPLQWISSVAARSSLLLHSGVADAGFTPLTLPGSSARRHLQVIDCSQEVPAIVARHSLPARVCGLACGLEHMAMLIDTRLVLFTLGGDFSLVTVAEVALGIFGQALGFAPDGVHVAVRGTRGFAAAAVLLIVAVQTARVVGERTLEGAHANAEPGWTADGRSVWCNKQFNCSECEPGDILVSWLP